MNVREVHILLGRIDELRALGFSTIEVWRSDDSGNSFFEVTGPTLMPAVARAQPANTQYRLGGTSLEFLVDEQQYIVSFDQAMPTWTPQQVVDRINQVSVGYASLSADGVPQITSEGLGRLASVEVTKCQSTDLGFALGVVRGVDVRLPLIAAQPLYLYTDLVADKYARYKWRISANGNDPVGLFSPVQDGVAPAMDPSKISVALARFIDAMGRPQQRSVIVASEAAFTANGYLVDGNSASVASDAEGFLQLPLLRGSKVRIGIEGTSVVRMITVPSAPSFDLIQALSEVPDSFTVMTVPPILTRRSL
jgi:hypothetical protein